jgi:hypothetical protein
MAIRIINKHTTNTGGTIMLVLNFGSLNLDDSESGWDEVRGFGQFLVPVKDLNYLKVQFPRVNTERKLLQVSNLFATKLNSDVNKLPSLRLWVECHFSFEDHEKSRKEKLREERKSKK